MKKRYLLSCVLFLAFCLMACDGLFSGSKAQIQFEIIEDNFNEDQKEKTKQVIQKRLQSLGASNIEFTGTQKNLIVNYEKGVDSILTWQSFQMQGKLEFYQVCKSRNLITDYLFEKYSSSPKEENLVTNDVVINKDFTEFMELVQLINGTLNDPIFGYVDAKHKARVEELLIHKKPVFISTLNRRVKFLLGKPDDNYQQGKYPLYVVFTASNNVAPLDGRYITHASAEERNSRHFINLQMNEEGAGIWERLTEKVYNENGFIAVVIDDFVYSAPSVSSGAIKGGRTQVSGSFTKNEALMLASIIRSGVLPKMKILKMGVVEEASQSK